MKIKVDMGTILSCIQHCYYELGELGACVLTWSYKTLKLREEYVQWVFSIADFYDSQEFLKILDITELRHLMCLRRLRG